MSTSGISTTLFNDLKAITIPLLSLITLVVIKAISLPGKVKGYELKELLNIGSSLRISGLMYIVMSFCSQSKIATFQMPQSIEAENIQFSHSCLILVYIILVLVFSLVLRTYAYDKANNLKTTWIVISDIIGVAMFLLAIWFMW